VRYRGRIDSQVKVRGFRVELGEVEAAIRAVPGVDEAAVFPVRDPSARVTGLTAAVKSTAAGISEAVVIEEIARVLPSYAIPHTVTILPELPIGVTGKLDRKALERRLTERAPAASLAPPREADGGPARSLGARHERIVAEAWSSVLGEDVSADTDRNFFDLGGNSALLGQVLTRLREQFPEANLQLVEMYRYPTVPAMAARLRTGSPAAHAEHAAPVPPQPPAGGSLRTDESRRTRLSAADRRRLARRTK
jgi:hypothetical protein